MPAPARGLPQSQPRPSPPMRFVQSSRNPLPTNAPVFLTVMIHGDGSLACGLWPVPGRVVDRDSRVLGMTAARLAGRAAGGSTGPAGFGFFVCRRDDLWPGQGAWGRAVIRSQAVTIAGAQG